MTADVWISAVIPAYNEERGIAGTVAAVREQLVGLGREWEIVVVDNASSDRTVERLSSLSESGAVRVLRNDRNRGKGHSVRRGMLEARGALRLHCDADCASSLPCLPAMIALAAEADVVVGSRLAPGARVDRRQPLGRRMAGRTFVGLCRLALREPTRDLFCGFKLWRADAATAVYSRTALEGWTFDAEALAMARALGYTVRETGIAWADREGSRLSMPRVILPVLRELVEARRRIQAARASGRPRDREAVDHLLPEPADPRP